MNGCRLVRGHLCHGRVSCHDFMRQIPSMSLKSCTQHSYFGMMRTVICCYFWRHFSQCRIDGVPLMCMSAVIINHKQNCLAFNIIRQNHRSNQSHQPTKHCHTLGLGVICHFFGTDHQAFILYPKKSLLEFNESFKLAIDGISISFASTLGSCTQNMCCATKPKANMW